MNTKFLTSVAAAATLAFAPAAFAQDTTEAEAAEAPAADVTGEADAAAPSAATAAASFTEEQIASFAKALNEIETIQADASLDATTKQTRMASAVETAGLDVNTFNAIATQSQTDAELQAKIQEHATQHSAP